MTIRLQETGLKGSTYERPDQKWICGWARDGFPCAMGPGPDGQCTAGAQSSCSPRREGDRFFCTRPAVYGGPCAQGPLPDGSCARPEPTHPPCQPQRSLRARRGRLVWLALLFSIGLLVILVGGPWRLWFVSPGPLDPAHRALRGPTEDASSCVACHAQADGSFLSWIGGAFSGTGAPVSRQCLACHFSSEKDAASPQALLPHSVASLASLEIHLPSRSGGAQTCESCHREHEGHQLAAMSNERCQICHTMQFNSLLDGHPEFQPMQRTARVRFDHVNHEQTHFGEKPFDCLRCHLPRTRSMSLGPFSNSCGSCHYQGKDDHHRSKIKSATPHVLFQLPYMEVPDDSAWWPEDAALGEELSPMMRLLLGGDDQALEPLRSLSLSDADWILDWWQPDPEELKTDLALATQRLFRELVAGGQPLANRLARTLEVPADSPEVVALTEQLSSGSLAVQTYQRRWMPGLLAGSGEGTGRGPDGAVPTGAIGWGMDAGVAAVTYQPTAHADPFLRAWIDAMGLLPDEAGTPAGLRRALRTDLFEELTSDGFGGYLRQTCLRCHAMDPSRPGLGRWTAAGGRGAPQGYRKFDHRTHVKLLQDGSCRSCHEFSAPDQSERSPGAPGAHTKAQCTECHAPAGADDDCLVCHDYHFQRP